MLNVFDYNHSLAFSHTARSTTCTAFHSVFYIVPNAQSLLASISISGRIDRVEIRIMYCSGTERKICTRPAVIN